MPNGNLNFSVVLGLILLELVAIGELHQLENPSVNSASPGSWKHLTTPVEAINPLSTKTQKNGFQPEVPFPQAAELYSDNDDSDFYLNETNEVPLELGSILESEEVTENQITNAKRSHHNDFIQFLNLVNGKIGSSRIRGQGKRIWKYDPALKLMGLGKREDSSVTTPAISLSSTFSGPSVAESKVAKVTYNPEEKRDHRYDPAMKYMGLGKKDLPYYQQINDENFEKKSQNYDPAMRYMGLGKKAGKYDPAMRFLGLGKKAGKYDPAMRFLGLGKRSVNYDPAIRYMGLGKKASGYDPAIRYMGLGKRAGQYDPAMRFMGLGKRAGDYDPAMRYMGLGKRAGQYDPAMRVMGLGKRAGDYDPAMRYMGLGKRAGQYDPAMRFMGLGKRAGDYDPAMRYMGLGKRTGDFDPAIRYMGLGKRAGQYDPAMRFMGLGKRAGEYDPAMRYMGLGKKSSKYDPAMRFLGLGKKDGQYDPAIRFMGLGKKGQTYDPAIRYMGLGKRAPPYDPAIRFMGLGKKTEYYDPAIRYMGLGKKDGQFDPAIRYMGLGKRTGEYDPAIRFMGLGKKTDYYDPAIRYMGLGKKNEQYDPAIRFIGLGKKGQKYDPAFRIMGLGKRNVKYDPEIKIMGLGEREYGFLNSYDAIDEPINHSEAKQTDEISSKRDPKFRQSLKMIGLGKRDAASKNDISSDGNDDVRIQLEDVSQDLLRSEDRMEPIFKKLEVIKRSPTYNPYLKHIGLGKRISLNNSRPLQHSSKQNTEQDHLVKEKETMERNDGESRPKNDPNEDKALDAPRLSQLSSKPRLKRDIFSSSAHFPSNRYRGTTYASEMATPDKYEHILDPTVLSILNSICLAKNQMSSPDSQLFDDRSESHLHNEHESYSTATISGRSMYDELADLIKRDERDESRPKFNPGWKFIGLGKRDLLPHGIEILFRETEIIPCSQLMPILESAKHFRSYPFPNDRVNHGIAEWNTLRGNEVSLSPDNPAILSAVESLVYKWATTIQKDGYSIPLHTTTTIPPHNLHPYEFGYYDDTTE